MVEKDFASVLNILGTSESNTMLGRMGLKHDSFSVLIATILSARAKDEVTEVVAAELLKTFPTVESLANADINIVREMIKRIGFYNVKSKHVIETARILLEEFNGVVPSTLSELIRLPGVGRKVANCVLVYSFKKDAIPVDTHVHRISNRLGWVRTKTPEETEEKLMQVVPKKYWQVLNDTFVSHGKSICTPISPFCSCCPVSNYCKRVGVGRSR